MEMEAAMPAWIGVQSVAYVPVRNVIVPPNVTNPGFYPPPSDLEDRVTRQLLFDPDPNGVDRSLKTYFFQVSYGRAVLEPTIHDPIDVNWVGNGLADTAGAAITAALANTNFQNASVVFTGTPANPPDWAFWGGPPISQTNVTGFCYNFLTSGVGAWGMELTHILTSFGDLYKTNDGDPWAFDNMACACGVHPSTFTKLKLGWLDPSEIVEVQVNSTTTVTLHALGLPRPSPPGRATAVKVRTADPQHYYLIEARLRTDSFEAGIPSEGVVVYEIQEAVWAPVHLRTPTALVVSQSYSGPVQDYNGYVQVTVNAAVPGGFTVEVVYPSNEVSVPDLTADDLAGARQALAAVGLLLRAHGVGDVVMQRPGAGTLVPKGSTVDVFLSNK
jgi:hypothetical protein